MHFYLFKSSSNVASKELHLSVHAEDAVHRHILVVIGDWRLEKRREMVSKGDQISTNGDADFFGIEKKAITVATYVFLG